MSQLTHPACKSKPGTQEREGCPEEELEDPAQGHYSYMWKRNMLHLRFFSLSGLAALFGSSPLMHVCSWF